MPVEEPPQEETVKGHSRISALEIAEDNLRRSGIPEGRGSTMLTLSLAASLRESTARALAHGEARNVDNQFERQYVAERIKEAISGSADSLWMNREVWERAAIALDFDVLKNTFTGDRGGLVQDAEVTLMMHTLTWASWGRTRESAWTSTVGDDVYAGLQELAEQTTDAESYAELVEAAHRFATSPLAEQVHNIAGEWYKQFFDPGSKSGRAIDGILEMHEIAKRPDAVMAAAKGTYKEAYGLDLDRPHLDPAAPPPPGGQL